MVRLKRINKTLIYRVAKITEWQLLTDFNPFYVSKKIDDINDYIESMYHLNTSVVHYHTYTWYNTRFIPYRQAGRTYHRAKRGIEAIQEKDQCDDCNA